MGNISIVIGSWGSYNECNERALGSKWLDLSDYNDWEEIVEELKREGFEPDGIDEETMSFGAFVLSPKPMFLRKIAFSSNSNPLYKSSAVISHGRQKMPSLFGIHAIRRNQ